jgi:hypothetical protein
MKSTNFYALSQEKGEGGECYCLSFLWEAAGPLFQKRLWQGDYSGMLEYWNVGILECWNIGMMEYWNDGILEFWNDNFLSQT